MIRKKVFDVSAPVQKEHPDTVRLRRLEALVEEQGWRVDRYPFGLETFYHPVSKERIEHIARRDVLKLVIRAFGITEYEKSEDYGETNFTDWEAFEKDLKTAVEVVDDRARQAERDATFEKVAALGSALVNVAKADNPA